MKKIFEKVRYILRRVGKKACSVLLILAILLGCASFGIIKENKTSKAFFVIDDATVIATLLTCALGGVAAGATYNYMTVSPSEIGLNTSNKDETLAYIHDCFSGNEDFQHVVTSAEMMYTFECAFADVLSSMPNSVAIPRKETYQKIWKYYAEKMVDGTSAVNMDSMLRQVKSATILKFPNTNNDDDDDDDDEKTDEERAEEEANTSEDLGEALENDKVILPSTFLDLVPSLALSTLICKGVSDLLSEEYGNIEKIGTDNWFSGCDFTVDYFQKVPFFCGDYSIYKPYGSINYDGYRFDDSGLEILKNNYSNIHSDFKIIPCVCVEPTSGWSHDCVKYKLVTNYDIDLSHIKDPNSQYYFPFVRGGYYGFNITENGYNVNSWMGNSYEDGDPFHSLIMHNLTHRPGVDFSNGLTMWNAIQSRKVLPEGVNFVENCYIFKNSECLLEFERQFKEKGYIDTNNIDSLYKLVNEDWWRYHSNTRTDPSQRDKSKDDDMSSEGKGKDKDGNTRHTKGIDPEKVNNGMSTGLYNEEETTGKRPTYTHGLVTPVNQGVIVGENGQNGRPLDYDEVMALINEQIAKNPNPYGDPNYDPAKDVQPEKDPQATTKPNQPTATPPKNTAAPTSTPISKDENFPDIYPILPSGDSEGIQWYERFPFCIPFDIAHTVEKLNAQAKPPSFIVPYTVKSLNYTQNVEVKLEDDTWEKVRNITRWFILIIFVVGLAILTRTIIRG